MLRFSTLAVLGAGLTLALCNSASASLPIPKPPQVDAHTYILIDYASGNTLAEQLPDERVEPASITKVMTVYVAFDQLRTGRVHMDDEVMISEKAWRQGIDSTESRMFVSVGQKVKLGDLLRGIIIQSGNDAAVAVAEYLGGTESGFAEIMNHYAAQLGLKGTHYEDASGLPNPQHYTTARDIATLSRALIRNFPEYYKIFNEREYTFHNIRQQNRNGLLNRDQSVDGIKTGHTSSAGYCLATSAMRNGMRLISVVMGSPSIKAREDASAALINYGYTFYESAKVKNHGAVLATPRVYQGAAPTASVGLANDLIVTVGRGDVATLQTAMKLDDPLIAPLAAGKRVGELTLTSNGKVVARAPMIVLKAVPEGGLWSRMVDGVSLWLHTP